MKENIVDVLNAWFDAKAAQIHTVIPGKVENYAGHGTRLAKVKPLVKLKTPLGASLSIPPIDNVPVIFPSSDAFTLLFPVKKGDGCLIAFSEAGIGNFLNGQGVNEVEPDDLNRFALTDAICIPGLWSKSSSPTSKATIEIDASGNMTVDGATIYLNGNTKPFVTHAELDAALQTFITALNLHMHPTAATGPPSPPASPMSINIAAAATTTVKTGG